MQTQHNMTRHVMTFYAHIIHDHVYLQQTLWPLQKKKQVMLKNFILSFTLILVDPHMAINLCNVC